ncbi:MAG TPA: hypothetical protein VL092_01270 [Chitinophagaceae bacterium]|nr:hypothetical protein [Chitinophagaceae bacterium]
MPTPKLIGTQLNSGQLSSILSQLSSIQNYLSTVSQNLTPEERQRYGSINEENKLLVGKVGDYRKTNAELSSPDIDWPNFEQSWASRSGFAQIETVCNGLIEICSDARILHDFYLYQNSLTDYDYSKYKAGSTTGGLAYTSKVEALKQFFPNTGGGRSGAADGSGNATPPAATE